MDPQQFQKLLTAAREGDIEACLHLYEFFRIPVFAFFRKKFPELDVQTANDFVADAILVSVKNKAKPIDHPGKFVNLLKKTVKNICLDFLKKEKIRSAQSIHTVLQKELKSNEPDPHKEACSKENLERLNDVINNLPEKYRNPLRLHYIDNLSYAKIAKILGISTNLVGVRIVRARGLLRKRFSDDEDYK